MLPGQALRHSVGSCVGMAGEPTHVMQRASVHDEAAFCRHTGALPGWRMGRKHTLPIGFLLQYQRASCMQCMQLVHLQAQMQPYLSHTDPLYAPYCWTIWQNNNVFLTWQSQLHSRYEKGPALQQSSCHIHKPLGHG